MPRTRHVFSGREVYHVWAQQNQATGRNSSQNRSFDGEFAYSYAEPTARLVNGVCLVRTRRFSATTARAVSDMVSAVRPRRVYHISNIGGRFGATIDHAENIADYRERIANAAKQTTAALTRTRWHHLEMRRLIAEAQSYVVQFDLSDTIEAPEIPGLAEKLERADHLNEKRNAQYQQERERCIAQREATDAQRQAEYNDALPKWLAGESITLPHISSSPDMLRIAPDGANVETTQGAVVPIAHVRRALPYVLGVLSRGDTFHDGSLRLGHYTLDSIDAGGNVNIGCHTFTRAEVERFAATVTVAVAAS